MDLSVARFLPFFFLSIALLLLWLRERNIRALRNLWLIALGIACLLALYMQQLQVVAIPIILLVAGLAWCAAHPALQKRWRWLAGLLFILSALALGLHLMPGFHSLPVMQNVHTSPAAQPYSLYFNFDKTLIGLFILGLCYQRPAKVLSWTDTGRTLLWMLPLIIISVITLSITVSYIQFEPKIIDGLWLWLWANLFFTCIAEEALFRGLIQHQLAIHLAHHSAGKWLATTIAAIMFGLAHIAGGGSYVLLATVAGFGYGILYQFTGRIEASIAGHFLLNLTHILLFTYPALKAGL